VDSSGDDRRGERRPQREQDPPGRYLFVSERGAPMSAVLVINLRAAKALGIVIPRILLAGAEQVIE
jgi:hypothetical protein